MQSDQLPARFVKFQSQYPELSLALEQVGQAARAAGPIDEKHAHLIQLAAAATIHSQGAVHSHVRRALKVGVTVAEIRHALVLLTSTIGYPTVAAALSWVDDVVDTVAEE